MKGQLPKQERALEDCHGISNLVDCFKIIAVHLVLPNHNVASTNCTVFNRMQLASAHNVTSELMHGIFHACKMLFSLEDCCFEILDTTRQAMNCECL